ncbi:hypothetical protein ACSQ67_011191 [Phaseolus vulgaris]
MARPIRYKHRYPRETSESVLSSQDALGSQTLDPLAEKIDVDEAYMISSEKEVMDSSAIKGNEFDELLDGLLSCNSEDLEGDGAISLLQERLQIKPVAVDKFSFPIFPDSQVTDLKSLQRNKSLQGNKSKPRKALSDIDNLLKGIITNKKTPLKKSEQFTVQQLSSPTPPRSPFASILSLQKHISRSRQSLDSFSLDEISMDNSEPNLVSGRPNEMNTRMIEHVVAVGKTSTVLDPDRNYTNTSEIPKEDNSRTSEAKNTVTNGTSTSRTSMEGNSMEPRFDVDIDSSELHFDINVGGIGMGKRVMDGTEDRSNIEPNMIEDVVAVGKTSTVLDTDINCTHASDISKEESYEKSSNDLIVSSIKDITAFGRTSLAEDTARNFSSAPQKSIVDNSRELRFDDNVDSYEPLVHMDVDVGGSDMGERVMDDIEDSLDIDAQMVEDVVAVIYFHISKLS